MIGAIRRKIDSFRGFGDYALSIPGLDGPFRPNTILDSSELLLKRPSPDNLVSWLGRHLFTSGCTLEALSSDGTVETLETATAPITALAASDDGRLAIAYSGGEIALIERDLSRKRMIAPLQNGSDVTAACFLRDGHLAVTIGAAGRKAEEWRHDLFSRGRSGSLWIVDPAMKSRQIAAGLAYPNGVVELADGTLVVSASWDTALLRVGRDGKVNFAAEHLPAYPSRMVPSSRGGIWVAFFAPRNQLVEFTLRERKYCQRMMAEIEPEYWVCPSLKPAESPLEVMLDGTQKIGGVIKPWAPSLSYGLIAHYGDDLLAQFSLHSRANGTRHGITSVVERDGDLIATSHGAAALLRIREKDFADER